MYKFELRWARKKGGNFMGCISCKLQLKKWKELIMELDSIANHQVTVPLFIHSKNVHDLKLIL